MERLLDARALVDRLEKTVAEWHKLPDPIPDDVVKADGIEGLVLREHAHNYRLWHHEDQARRRDVTDAIIASVKRSIDRANQLRNDAIESIDDELIRRLAEQGVTPPESVPMNSETPGSILDRLSIITLKIYHMREETQRKDADAAHREKCAQRLTVLERQRRDLTQCLDRLISDLAAGRLRLAVYRQFKMYNDPALNPAMYAASKSPPRK